MYCIGPHPVQSDANGPSQLVQVESHGVQARFCPVFPFAHAALS
jgi:hypothetical protein